MIEGNFDTVIKDALEQVAAGATMLDVNAGVTSVNPNETEPGLLVKTLEIVQGLVDVPLAIDSSVTAAIEAALKVAKGRPLVNSVTGEEEKLEAIRPLCAKYNVPVVAISNDETRHFPRIRKSASPSPRRSSSAPWITASSRMTSSSTRWSCRSAPSVRPASQVFALIRRLLREELKVNTTCGLSNISFGLPPPPRINAGFIPMVIGAAA